MNAALAHAMLSATILLVLPVAAADASVSTTPDGFMDCRGGRALAAPIDARVCVVLRGDGGNGSDYAWIAVYTDQCAELPDGSVQCAQHGVFTPPAPAQVGADPDEACASASFALSACGDARTATTCDWTTLRCSPCTSAEWHLFYNLILTWSSQDHGAYVQSC